MQSPPSKEHHRLVPRCPAHPLAAVSPSRYNCHPDSKSHHFLDHLCYVNPPKHTQIVSGLSMCICGCVLFLLLSTMCVQFICVAVWNCNSCLLIADAASRHMNVSKCILPTFDGLSVMSFGGLSWTLAEPLHLHPQLSWIMENCFPKRLCQFTLAPVSSSEFQLLHIFPSASSILPKSAVVSCCVVFICIFRISNGIEHHFMYWHLGLDFLCLWVAGFLSFPLKNSGYYFFILHIFTFFRSYICYRIPTRSLAFDSLYGNTNSKCSVVYATFSLWQMLCVLSHLRKLFLSEVMKIIYISS